MNNIGFIPVKNYIVTIEILDEKKHYDENNISILLITKHFRVINIIDYLTDMYHTSIEYEIDKTEFSYKHYMALPIYFVNKSIIIKKKYEINKIYNDMRYYYINFDVALSENFMYYKLYKKFGDNYSGVYKSYHPNGKIKKEFFHINGILEGLYKSYDVWENIEEEINYVNGERHGLSKKYNGKVETIENYNMGKLDGLCIYYNFSRSANKDCKIEITYSNNIINGIYRKYHSYKYGGNIHIECNIINNRYNGIYREYDTNGDLLIECDYKIYNKEIKNYLLN
jgi:antitoxin component YwqK of YwqJK toxin-antitoxin module